MVQLSEVTIVFRIMTTLLQQPAPKFTLQNAYRKNVSLSQFQGQWIILYFYPKDNTPGCSLEAMDFSTRKKIFEKHNTTILGISKDTCESHQKFIDKKGLTITLLSDPKGKVQKDYGVWKKKSMFGKTFFGTKRSTFLINPKGEVVHEWQGVRVKDHAETVLKKLLELQKS